MLFNNTSKQDLSKRILKELSGKTHTVKTAVSFFWDKEHHTFHVTSEVTFRNIDDKTLEIYLDTEDGLDKAGSYGIQGPGLTFVSKVKGSYSNIVGLPLDDLLIEIQNIFEGDINWRDKFEGFK